MFDFVTQDLELNTNGKARLVLIWFRASQLIVRNRFSLVLFFPFLFLYRIIVEWFMGIELNWDLRIGKLRLYHGQGLIIHPDVIIGEGCTLRCNTVIGNQGDEGGVPNIGNNVDVGANVVIIGDIDIGSNVTIGAGSVVTKSIPDNSMVIGNPGRVTNKNPI